MTKEMSFLINGQSVAARYSDAFLEGCVVPLLVHWREMAKQKKRRMIVFLAAPPAAGKSTLAALFESISKKEPDQPQVQALGMDGFHHYQSYILTHEVMVDGAHIPMKSVKGCPESFDFERFQRLLQTAKAKNCLWPHYNRMRHDVEDDVIEVKEDILLIEGNYLLLDEEPWKQLSSLCDESIFIDTTKEAVKTRLINRKIAGGSLIHEAIHFFEQSDGRNVERILAHRLKADITLYFDGTNYKRIN